jgi:hypothetical protein
MSTQQGFAEEQDLTGVAKETLLNWARRAEQGNTC